METFINFTRVGVQAWGKEPSMNAHNKALKPDGYAG